MVVGDLETWRLASLRVGRASWGFGVGCRDRRRPRVSQHLVIVAEKLGKCGAEPHAAIAAALGGMIVIYYVVFHP